MKQILKFILSVISDNMKFAETKHSITLALASGIILFASYTFDANSTLQTVFSASAILLCALSIFYSMLALSSRTLSKLKPKHRKKEPNSFMFYEDIAGYDEIEYAKKLAIAYGFPKTYKPDKQELDLARHIIVYSRISKAKFRSFNLAVFFLAFAICFLVVSVIVNSVLVI